MHAQVPTDRPDILLLIRCTYVLSQLIQFGLFFYASLQIKKKNDLTVLKYSEPAKPFSQVSRVVVCPSSGKLQWCRARLALGVDLDASGPAQSGVAMRCDAMQAALARLEGLRAGPHIDRC